MPLAMLCHAARAGCAHKQDEETMKHFKRLFTCAVAAFACVAAPAFAAYPDKTVKIVVPYPPGGTTDILARFIAQELGTKLKQSFIVENRGGASGAIGSQH